MEGWCMYCKSGTGNLTIVHKDGVGEIKACPDCKDEYHDCNLQPDTERGKR